MSYEQMIQGVNVNVKEIVDGLDVIDVLNERLQISFWAYLYNFKEYHQVDNV